MANHSQIAASSLPKKKVQVEQIVDIENVAVSIPRVPKRTTVSSLILARWLASKSTPPRTEAETGWSTDERSLNYGTPPPIEEPHCYSVCASESSCTEEFNCTLQVNKDIIRNRLIEHMRYVGGRLQLLDDLEMNKLDLDDPKRVATVYKREEINTLLLYASFVGQVDLIAALHKCGADLNYSEQGQGLAPLHLCAFSNSLEGVQYLLTNGANMYLEQTHTPFHYAAFGNASRVVQHFLQLGISQESPLGEETVLHAAARSNASNVLKLLAPNNPTLNDLDCNGYAAIHHVADKGDPACLTMLLDAGCHLDLMTKKGDTALHLAAEASCVEIVDLLVEHGANVHLKNHRGQTALHIASRSHCLECVEILLKKGGCDPNVEDNDGRTSLHLALGRSLLAYEVTEFLVTWKANVNKTDKYGYTPLHIAALNELSQCVDILIQRGADLSARTKGGTSALSIILRKTPTSLNVFKQRLNTSITLHQHGSATGEIELRLDFHPLLMHQQQGEIRYLGTFVKEGYKEILEHPLCQAFLHLKWQKIRKYYVGRLVFYLFYVLILTGWVMTALAHNCYNESHGQLDNTQPPLCANTTGINGFLYRHPALLEMEWYALMVLTILEAIRKLTSIPTYLSVRQFFAQAENMVEWCVILSVFATSFIYTGRTYAWQSHVGAFAVLCGWSNLMLMIGQLPIFGAYVAMFTSVQAQVFKLLLAYACLLVGFTASFCVIFPRSKSFSSPHIGLIKVLVMMTGELNFEDLFFPIEEDGKPTDAGGTSWILLQLSAQLSFVLFLLFVTIVLMNLLVGIAVHDIKGLQKTAGLAKLVRQTKLIYDVETALFLGLMPKRLTKFLRWTALLLPSPLRAVLTVRPLNPRETRLPRDLLSAAHKVAKERKNASGTLCSRKSNSTTYTYLKSEPYSTIHRRLPEEDAFIEDSTIKGELEELKRICERNQTLLQDLIMALVSDKQHSTSKEEDETNRLERSSEEIHDSRECLVLRRSSFIVSSDGEKKNSTDEMEDKRTHESTSKVPKINVQRPSSMVDEERSRRYSLTSLRDRRLSFDEKDCRRTIEAGDKEAQENVDKTITTRMKSLASHEKRTRHYSLTRLKNRRSCIYFDEEKHDSAGTDNGSINEIVNNKTTQTLRMPSTRDGKTRHCSMSNLNDRSNDHLSTRLASTFRSVRYRHTSNSQKIVINDTPVVDSANDHIEIDAGTPPPADESLFYDNLDVFRQAQVNGNDLRSIMWSIVTPAEMKLLLELEKCNALPELPTGERIRNIIYVWCCYRGLIHLLPKLEQLGANLEYTESRTGMNAILAASLSGNVACIKHLIKKGADVNCRNPINHYTALHFAVLGKSLDAAQVLLDNGAKPSTYLYQEILEPVLHSAIRAGAIEIVKLLLDRGTSVVEKNHMGETPLHVACFVQSMECVELLLKSPGTNINAVDRAHRTPLHFAVMTTHSSAKLVEVLLKHGALMNAADKTGFTPLHVAALNEQSHCVDVLIWAGADVSATTSAGLSALNIILRKIPESLQVFRQRLDASITLSRPVPHNREFEMRLHFDLLFPSDNQCETSFINTFVQERRKDLLSHPLVMAFLHLKWEKIRKFYLLRIMLYAMTVICMTTYVLTALAYKCYNYDEANSLKICSSKRLSGFLFRRPVIEIQWYLLLIFTCISIPRKIFGFMVYTSAKQYFSNIDNVLDGVVIISVFVTSFVYTGRTYDWQNYVGAFAILCAWTNLMLMVGQLPAFGTYVAMFTHIQFEFAKLLLAYSGLLIGFTVSFCVIFVGEPSFGNPFTGLIKVLAMMAGELDFEGLITQIDDKTKGPFVIYHPLSVCSQILFTLFIVFVTVILMNLLVGIAVHDIQGLRNHAGLTKLVRQTKLILFTEMVLHNSSIPYAFRKWMSDHKINVENRKRVLVVKPLNPLEKRLPKDILKAAYEVAQKNIPFMNDDNISLSDHVMWMRQQSEENSDSNLQLVIENLTNKLQSYEDTIKLLKEQLLNTNKTLENVIQNLAKEKKN
ncbi:ankyrin repeat domain 61 water witch [Colletes latitarsis]|uniref:ankyrin repeat domain 61 water witch n=1 Tax=Colletes latitarsis TaxID=2605962 RepID=UPI004036754A